MSAPPVTSPGEALRRTRLREAKAELEALDRQIVAKTAEEQRLRGVVASYQQRIEAAPSREAELSGLTRDYDTFQQNYRSLLSKKQESQIATNLERRQIGEQFKILDQARLPEKPSSPDRPRLYALAVVGALAVGLACAALFEYRDETLRSEEDVKLVLNLLVLATVPLLEPAGARARGNQVARRAVTAGLLVVGLMTVAWTVWA